MLCIQTNTQPDYATFSRCSRLCLWSLFFFNQASAYIYMDKRSHDANQLKLS